MLTDTQFEERARGIGDMIENSREGGHGDGWALVLALSAVAESLLLLNEQMRTESKRTR